MATIRIAELSLGTFMSRAGYRNVPVRQSDLQGMSINIKTGVTDQQKNAALFEISGLPAYTKSFELTMPMNSMGSNDKKIIYNIRYSFNEIRSYLSSSYDASISLLRTGASAGGVQNQTFLITLPSVSSNGTVYLQLTTRGLWGKDVLPTWSGTWAVSEISTNPPIQNCYVYYYNVNGTHVATDTVRKGGNHTTRSASTAGSKSKYHFAGWSTSNGGSASYSAGQTITVNSDLYLYPAWSPNIYYIYQTAGGGTISSSSFKKVGYDYIVPSGNSSWWAFSDHYGSGNTLYNYSSFGLTKKGYHQDGTWKMRNTSTVIGEDTSLDSITLTHYSNSNLNIDNTNGLEVIFDPVWIAETYTVTYNGNGGLYNGNSTWSNTATYGSSYHIEAGFFSRDGYIFVGWSTDPNATASGWTPDSDWTWSYDYGVTLYAVWSTVSYTINYYDDDNLFTSQTVGYQAGYIITEKKPIRQGYEFLGWSATKGSSTAEYKPGSSHTYNQTGDLKLYSVWKISTNTYIYTRANGWAPYMCYIYINGEWTAYIAYNYSSGKWNL